MRKSLSTLAVLGVVLGSIAFTAPAYAAQPPRPPYPVVERNDGSGQAAGNVIRDAAHAAADAIRAAAPRNPGR